MLDYSAFLFLQSTSVQISRSNSY